MDINSRVTAFRLQTAQRLLYSRGLPWTDTACLLLRKAGRLGYDKQLFLVQPQSVDTETGLPSFYLSVLQAWQTVTAKRRTGTTPGMWIFEEPLFGNDHHHLPGPVVCQSESQTDRGWTSQTGSSAERHLSLILQTCSASGPPECCSGWWRRSVLPCQQASERLLRTVLYLTNGMMNVSTSFPPWLCLQLWDSGSQRKTTC